MILKYFTNSNGINTKTKILFRCDKCDKEYTRVNRDYLVSKNNPCYDMDYCTKCWRKVLNNRPEYKANMSKAINKMYRDKPYIRDKKRKSMMGKNVGDSNGVKQLDARKKVSKTRKKMFRDNPGLKKVLSEQTKKAWADGKFEGVRVGQCKWYDYKHSNGEIYKVQGTWELAFVKWLDDSNLKFKCHRGRVPYKLEGKDKNYYPDFWVYKWNAYAEVKCKHFYNKDKHKAIKKCNKNIDIKILFKKDLLKLGVKI